MLLRDLYFLSDVPSTFLMKRAMFCLDWYIICLLASVVYVNQMKKAHRNGDVTDQQLKHEIQNVKKGLRLLTWLVVILDSMLVMMALTV